MPDRALVQYIREQLQQGKARDEVKRALLASGWQEAHVAEAFAVAENGAPLPPVPPPPPTDSAPASRGSLPGAAALFGETWRAWTRRWGTLFLIALFPAVLNLAFQTSQLGVVRPVEFSPRTLLLVLGEIIGGIIVFIAYVWDVLALIHAVRDEAIGFKDAYRRAWGQIAGYVWISVLLGLTVFGGFTLLIVPGVIVAVLFGQAANVLVAENARGMQALMRSRAYVKGNWWKVLWYGIFFFIVIVLILFLPAVCLNIIDKATGGYPFGRTLYNLLVATIAFPFGATYGFLIYLHLRAQKGDIGSPPRAKRFIFLAIWGVCAIPLFLFAILFFILASSPQRLLGRARDMTRGTDLVTLNLALEKYAHDHQGAYPDSLSELAPAYLPRVPADPAGAPYRYEASSSSYALCANFDSRPEPVCLAPQGVQ